MKSYGADIIDLGVRRDAYEAPPRFYSGSHRAEVRSFTPRIALCGRCGSDKHRASKCPLNARDTMQLGD